MLLIKEEGEIMIVGDRFPNMNKMIEYNEATKFN
jgi:hypothetical protein